MFCVKNTQHLARLYLIYYLKTVMSDGQTDKYNQTCIKRTPLGKTKKWSFNRQPLKRGSIHMKFSMTG